MGKWTIWKGCHFSLSNIWKRLIPRIGTGPVAYTFKLPKETWFPYKDTDDLDVNKLFGYGYGNHHNDSIRLGWSPDFGREGYFILYSYIYNNGVRTIKYFATIKADTEYFMVITLFRGVNYVNLEMTSGDTPVKVKKNEKFVVPASKYGYYLWWYFGGNKSAPKKMKAWIKQES